VTDFRPLTTQAELDALWRASEFAPIIILKHSQTCGVSHMARDLLASDDLPAPVHEVVVQRQRELSQAIASTLGVRHESPQLLIVVGGKAVWHTSHAGVTPARLAAAWRQASVSVTPVPGR
jgi:bacillithiol system protein YtxJ